METFDAKQYQDTIDLRVKEFKDVGVQPASVEKGRLISKDDIKEDGTIECILTFFNKYSPVGNRTFLITKEKLRPMMDRFVGTSIGEVEYSRIRERTKEVKTIDELIAGLVIDPAWSAGTLLSYRLEINEVGIIKVIGVIKLSQMAIDRLNVTEHFFGACLLHRAVTAPYEGVEVDVERLMQFAMETELPF
ncbi:hypothetical protein PQD71_gp225 [Kosakonia phage Kc263]|uniref:Uncharacterized protein n=1 Tax=Kosakonia phage Kc263 TaxID=2863194 RepID=A0AAE7WGU4_9CAUD|nr:hypothetical protein PQD71_gp225 [Kosakonia phage Kc263]QYN80101.1 hypothetical protein [Kosakonia phage Kc263]